MPDVSMITRSQSAMLAQPSLNQQREIVEIGSTQHPSLAQPGTIAEYEAQPISSTVVQRHNCGFREWNLG